VAPYFSTATHDDPPSLYSAFAIRVRPNPVVQGLVTTPALVSVICSVLTGVIAGIIVSQIASGMEPPTAVGVLGFLACMIGLTIYRERSFRAFTNVLEVRFPRTE
jgi:hypothetical protein